MAQPSELSLAEIREFMLVNRGKVTNHALVKHFKKFLTHPKTQNEARKNFKTYVNVLATSKTEGTEKFLLLRKRYYNECPTEDAVAAMAAMTPTSPDAKSFSDVDSPSRAPPPYRPPPEPTTPTTPTSSRTVVPINGPDRSSNRNFRDCIDEFKNAITILKPNDQLVETVEQQDESTPSIPPRKRNSIDKTITREASFDMVETIESPRMRESSVDMSEINQSPRNRAPLIEDQQNIIGLLDDADTPTKISVKRATEKFNRIASEEEEAAKIASPPGKIAKKTEKNTDDKENLSAESLIGHPKSKEWMVSAARANYQELAKLSSEFPELTRFKTALHWAAKHGNEDVVKLIAGRHKANVNSQTGYTPLHLAMQFGRDNIFELLCNTYKADRDLLDWSGRKALDYRKQKTSVSPSTFSKIKAKKKHSEKDLGFLRIGSLNVRVKKTTEAFSNFLGVGSNHHSSSHPNNAMIMAAANNHQMNRVPLNARTSAPPNSTYFEKIHKNWGSADNIPHDNVSNNGMPPPKYGIKKHRTKRGAGDFNLPVAPNRLQSHSTPTTPNQTRAPIGIVQEHPYGEKSGDSDSDSAYGFDSNWSGGKAKDAQRPTYI